MHLKVTYSIVISTIKIQHSIEKVVSLSFYNIQWVISISNEFIKIKQLRWKIKYKVGKKLNVESYTKVFLYFIETGKIKSY